MIRIKVDLKKVMLSLLFVFVLVIFGNTTEAKAASYKLINCQDKAVKVGSTIFTFEKGNDTSTLYVTRKGVKKEYISDRWLKPMIITNGTYVYCYTENNIYAGVYGGKVTKQWKDLFYVESQGFFSLEGLYNNKLYYTEGLDPGKFCSYNLKTRKKKVIDNNTSNATSKGRYYYLTPYEGTPTPSTLKVYDAKKGKKKTITKNMLNYTVRSGKVYYVDCKKYGAVCNTNIVRANANGTKKKILLKNIKMQYPIEITNKYVKYVNKNGKTVKKKFK